MGITMNELRAMVFCRRDAWVKFDYRTTLPVTQPPLFHEVLHVG